jgi:acetyl esterase/lipase
VRRLAWIVSLLFLLTGVRADSRSAYFHDSFAYGEDQRQFVEVYLPDATSDAMAIVFLIHGGGYVAGEVDNQEPYAEFLAENGLAVVAPEYRLAPNNPYPDPIDDLFCALAWMTSNAEEFGFDLTRVVLVGESAGGNAAALLSAHDDPSQHLTGCAYALPDDFATSAVVTYYMYGDMSTCARRCGLLRRATGLYLGQPLIDLSAGELTEAWGDASPLVWIDAEDPPVLAIHGLLDDVVPPSETELYAERLQEAGVPVETLYLKTSPHGFNEKFNIPGSFEARDATLRFILSELGISD